MKLIESEKKLEKSLKHHIERLGGFCLKMSSQHFTGLPDRICLFPDGVIFFAEIKTTGKKPTKIQLLVHKRLKDLGFKVELIESTKDIRKLMSNHA